MLNSPLDATRPVPLRFLPLFLLLFSLSTVFTVQAQTVLTVTTLSDNFDTPVAGSLREAINTANADPNAAYVINFNVAGGGTLNLAANVAGARMLPILTNLSGISINGANGAQGAITIDGGSTSGSTGDRIFFIGVASGTPEPAGGNMTATTSAAYSISNLTLQNGNARGGAGGTGGNQGGGGGGGGAGLGGAIFVNAGNVSVSGVTLSGNRAVGGDGGAATSATGLRGGGGGGSRANVAKASGGAGGAKTGTGTAGTAGQGIGSGLFLAGSATYSVSNGNTVTLADDIGGGTNALITGGFTKSGTGTLALTGSNTYTGGTTVSAGTLLVNNSSGSGTGSGSVTVGSTATLGGSGSIGGQVFIGGGATLMPWIGSASNLKTQDIFWTASDSVYKPIADFSGLQSADLLSVTGTVNIANSTLDLSSALNIGSITNGETLMLLANDSTDAISGTFATIVAPTGYSATVDYAYSSTDALGRVGLMMMRGGSRTSS